VLKPEKLKLLGLITQGKKRGEKDYGSEEGAGGTEKVE